MLKDNLICRYCNIELLPIKFLGQTLFYCEDCYSVWRLKDEYNQN